MMSFHCYTRTTREGDLTCAVLSWSGFLQVPKDYAKFKCTYYQVNITCFPLKSLPYDVEGRQEGKLHHFLTLPSLSVWEKEAPIRYMPAAPQLLLGAVRCG